VLQPKERNVAKVLTRKDERDADRQIAIIERRSSRAAILHILRTLARDAARFPEQKRDLVRMAPITMIDCLESKQGDACSVEDLAVFSGTWLFMVDCRPLERLGGSHSSLPLTILRGSIPRT